MCPGYTQSMHTNYILSKRSSASREDCKEALEVDLVGRATSVETFLTPTLSAGLDITGGFAGGFLTSLFRLLLTGGELTSLELPPRRLDIAASTDSSSTTAYNNTIPYNTLKKNSKKVFL